MKARVTVTLKSGILDPQGKAIEGALRSLGIAGVSSVRQGKVFDKPVRMWAAGVTGESTRDNPQRVLVGPPQQQEAWGTGMIPGDAIVDTITGRGVPNGLDSVVVRYGGGGDVKAVIVGARGNVPCPDLTFDP